MRVEESRERRIRKEEAKSKKVGGTETAELSRNNMERVEHSRERESNAIKRSHCPTKKGSRRETGGEGR